MYKQAVRLRVYII